MADLKSKEQILESQLNRYLLKVLDISHGTDVVQVCLERAMDEYAKQQCLEFEKYLLKTDIAYESVYTAFLENLNRQK